MTDVQQEIDKISRESGYGRRQQAHTNALYGLNLAGMRGNNIPHNTDNQGVVFFTRPRLNLTYYNLAADRVMTTLMANNGKQETIQKAIRAVLDPLTAGKVETSGNYLAPNVGLDSITSNLIDNRLPFIALLSNHLTSLSGWPDPSVDTFTSHEGINKEAWSMVDGQQRIFSTFDLTATFRNVAGDPISFLFNIWTRYASNVYTGKMMPYPDAILLNEIDYQTRIFRFTLDPSRQYITKVASTIAFPYSVSLGGSLNFSTDLPFVSDNAQEITVPFRCVGADYMDPIIMHEFNQTMQDFNPDMNDPSNSGLVKLAPVEWKYYNYYGYPFIDESTFELQWWVYQEDYDSFKSVAQQAAEQGVNVNSTGTPGELSWFLGTSDGALSSPGGLDNNGNGQ